MRVSIRAASVLLCVLCLHASIAAAQTQAPPAADAQQRLAGSRGMALYTYDPDGDSGHSQCDGVCAALWPPYLAAAGAKAQGDFGLVTRSDHSLQWSYRGRPLYRYAADTAPGTALGDGVKATGMWRASIEEHLACILRRTCSVWHAGRKRCAEEGEHGNA